MIRMLPNKYHQNTSNKEFIPKSGELYESNLSFTPDNFNWQKMSKVTKV